MVTAGKLIMDGIKAVITFCCNYPSTDEHGVQMVHHLFTYIFESIAYSEFFDKQ